MVNYQKKYLKIKKNIYKQKIYMVVWILEMNGIMRVILKILDQI